MPDALDSLIPHRPPMRWINALTHCDDTTARATAIFPAGHFAETGGLVSETALVECVAQTMAAAQAKRAVLPKPAGPSRGGMLAAVSRFRIESRPPLDRPLQIEVRELKRFGPMLLVEGVVSCEGRRLASGELTLYA